MKINITAINVISTLLRKLKNVRWPKSFKEFCYQKIKRAVKTENLTELNRLYNIKNINFHFFLYYLLYLYNNLNSTIIKICSITTGKERRKAAF